MGRRIAVLGGLFDPPHLGHFLVASQVLESLFEIEKVFFMPAFKHPWRKSFAGWKDRLEMTMFLTNTRLKVDTWEIGQQKISYTIETVLELRRRKDEYFWVVGSDAISSFQEWKSYRILPKMIKFLVFPRAGYPVQNLPDNFFSLAKSGLVTTSISSTIIRERIKKGQSIKNLVPEKIEKFIKKKYLYQ